ncbi:hypothetical protein TrLO_g6785 [Triparma laevis f. longispina]|uniref:Uncharacterized protein n=1 Tax=Triparma laevis f. longispina TaxID=1714387 RepID=A0A9W7KVT9_9STRA|nr:hypothetical protein TrLO_g6785 [Triparma laevis f. longispina]
MPATVSVGDTHDTQETKQNVDEFLDAGIFARPAQLLWSCAMIVSASFGCVEFKLWQALMSHSTSATAVNHMVMTLSVMSSLSILTLKVYMESLRPTRFKDKLVYENFKTHTHLAIVLLLFSSLTFNIALWPKYGFLKTCAIAAMVGYGILFNFFMLVPWTSVQNFVGMVGCMFFLQNYYGLGGTLGQ